MEVSEQEYQRRLKEAWVAGAEKAIETAIPVLRPDLKANKKAIRFFQRAIRRKLT